MTYHIAEIHGRNIDASAHLPARDKSRGLSPTPVRHSISGVPLHSLRNYRCCVQQMDQWEGAYDNMAWGL